ncbi:MAG: cytidylate kinase-like family protein [Deltaproteobacteria bacterium]|nr:cytidylate kinase-like family protein [Deltaproteobacteria bacterium]
MAIITISRGSYSKGKEIAERVAERLGYECIARRVLLEASDGYNIPEVKLVRAIHDAPSFFGNLSRKKEKYVSFIQAEILEHFRKDNVVYHGLAGHFFVKGISHVLKVRVIADLEDRVRLEMEREGISRKEALEVLSKDDEERVKWSKNLYGIDTRKPNLYDLVIHIHKLTVEDAVDIICHAAGLPQFQATPESQRAIDGLALAARVKAAVVDVRPDIEVTAEDGIVFVKTEAPVIHEASLVQKIQKISKNIAGVKEIKIHIIPSDVE